MSIKCPFVVVLELILRIIKILPYHFPFDNFTEEGTSTFDSGIRFVEFFFSLVNIYIFPRGHTDIPPSLGKSTWFVYDPQYQSNNILYPLAKVKE